jgi:nucleotide-binding universal stress UspA family protein
MNVLLAIDESPCSTAAIEAVINQCRPRDTVVRVLHVIRWPHTLPTSLMFAEGSSAAERVVRAHDEIRRRARELVARAVCRLDQGRFKASAHVIEGEPREEILAMAAAWPADAIVVGSHGRRGLDRVFLGSVSDGVVRHAACSVMVVREPAGNGPADVGRSASA